MKPFLKWAGGKAQHLEAIKERMPKEIDTYYEPFVGAGAIFFGLASGNLFNNAVISDVNEDLINTYKMIRDDTDKVIDELNSLKKKFVKSKDKKEFYYNVRDKYNQSEDKLERVSLMIFLNKTCFNGIYRLTRDKKFNVPFNHVEKEPPIDVENIYEVGKLLRRNGVKIVLGDYQKVLDGCKLLKNDFCYFDPPFEPVTPKAYTVYNPHPFTFDDQIALSNYVKKLKIKMILSNSEHPDIEKLYADKCKIEKVSTLRAINSNASKRKGLNELMILNY